jgi:hypothetical protein
MPWQVDQVQPVMPRQLLTDTAPDTAVHGPAMQHHEIGALAYNVDMESIHIMLLFFMLCVLPISG